MLTRGEARKGIAFIKEHWDPEDAKELLKMTPAEREMMVLAAALLDATPASQEAPQ